MANPISSPPTTTNPSNHLPMGNEIKDIVDPNLTMSQINSLAPEDRKARESFYADEYTENLPQDIVVNARRPNGAATNQEQNDASGRGDWRVRLSLAPNSNYLYNSNNPDSILVPLKTTDGVIFPYTPQITTSYSASYDPVAIVHTNYLTQQYTRSSVDQVTISCDFTAQDTKEANYMLAVIHFFRSVTKMFYGQDQSPIAGTPPPLCYLHGLGSFQFSGHPLAISNFSYNLPSDVDYIKTTTETIAGNNTRSISNSSSSDSLDRLIGKISKGGSPPPPNFSTVSNQLTTYVPTKIQIVVNCVPIMSRNMTSNEFSFEKYATGSLLSKGFW